MTHPNAQEEAPHWRRATDADLDIVNRIADAIHVDLPERPEVFADKLNLFPPGCYVLVQSGEVVGYGISHPWRLNDIPPLDAFLGTLPLHSECLFVHDVVVLPQARKHGAAGDLVQLLAGIALQRNISYLALVSVYDTDPLWKRHGFEITSGSGLAEKLESYGATAKYMTRKLD
jgi:GNAT superfamily N-acetyltransferase